MYLSFDLRGRRNTIPSCSQHWEILGLADEMQNAQVTFEFQISKDQFF